MKKILIALAIVALAIPSGASDFKVLLNNDWRFATGNASSMEEDFTHGTEYFTYLGKAKSSGHSRSPIMPEFDDSRWNRVSLPHDWAVDLPYSQEASHSHGYKCIGWNYPENSVGWYRHHLFIPHSDKGKQISIEFEGIYRNSQVFCNGFYLGHEASGYVSRVYELTPYLVYGGDNVITVRCDASLEEGWYYEGAGIYRNVYLYKSGDVAVKPYSLRIKQKDDKGVAYVDSTCVDFELKYKGGLTGLGNVHRKVTILDAEGNTVERANHLWSLEEPYLYTLNIKLFHDHILSSENNLKFGVRTIGFTPDKGFLLNGKTVKLKGCNLHLDHAGVGTGVPDELWRYRIGRLKELGFNAVRTSHNCASPSMLDVCDELGVLVIDENRQLGVNEEQLGQLRNMIDRDRNHPSVIMWSIGNEEWALENDPAGTEIASVMSAYVNSLDSDRPSVYGNAGGTELVKGVDVFGYNYIVQNPIDRYHDLYPEHCAVGTEETSGAGTRGHYITVPDKGWMAPLNRSDTAGRVNVIEYGWKFYKSRPWGLGLFYWTGQDYRGEPNPMKWPATGSQFGILDYCCFPKDEAFYLKSVWMEEPLVHVCGPCNGQVWVYSNCQEVTLYANGKSLGRKRMPEDGHLAWNVDGTKDIVYKAVGYIKGSRTAVDSYPIHYDVTRIVPHKSCLAPDGQDIVVIDIYTPEELLDVRVDNAVFLGWGNGDPGFKDVERPIDGDSLTIRSFSGCAQVIVRSVAGSKGLASISIGPEKLQIPIRTGKEEAIPKP